MTVPDAAWLHSQAGIAARFDYQDRWQTLEVHYTTILGQVPDTETWIVCVEGLATDRGEYWWPVTEYLAVSHKADGTPIVVDATDEQQALFTHRP